MPNGDVYQIVDTQRFAGQLCLNVYFFEMNSAPLGFADAEGAVDGFVTNFLPLLLPVQSAELVHMSVRATNLFDGADTYEALISEAGTIGGTDYVSTFQAFGFKLSGDNGSVRSGAKRLAGVVEGATTDGVVTEPGTLSDLNDIANAMAAPINFGLLDAGRLVPVIVKRLLVDGNYVLPSSTEEAILSFVLDVLFDVLVTSQVSRKIGVGE